MSRTPTAGVQRALHVDHRDRLAWLAAIARRGGALAHDAASEGGGAGPSRWAVGVLSGGVAGRRSRYAVGGGRRRGREQRPRARGGDSGVTASIAREHLYGATIWAYGAGGARVRPWVHSDHFSRFNGVDR